MKKLRSIVAIIALLTLIAGGVLVTVQDALAAHACAYAHVSCCWDCDEQTGCWFSCSSGYPFCAPYAWCFCCECWCGHYYFGKRCCGWDCFSSGMPCM